MKVYFVFLAFVVIVVGAYLDTIWLSVLGLALVGLFANFPSRKRRPASDNERYHSPTVFRK